MENHRGIYQGEEQTIKLMFWIILWAQSSITKNRANIPPKMAFTRLRDPYHQRDQYLIECVLTQNAVRFHIARTTWGTYAFCWKKKFANASETLNKWSSVTNSQNTFCSLQWTHALGVASTMLYKLQYKLPISKYDKIQFALSFSLVSWPPLTSACLEHDIVAADGVVLMGIHPQPILGPSHQPSQLNGRLVVYLYAFHRLITFRRRHKRGAHQTEPKLIWPKWR